MVERNETDIELKPQALTASKDALGRIEADFIDHLMNDRGYSKADARKETAQILTREVERSQLSDDPTFYSIQQGNTAIGIIWLSLRGTPERREWQLLYLEIFPEFRRRGWAASALQKLIDLAEKSSVFSIGLNVSPGNKAALALYEKMGFEADGNGFRLRLRRMKG